MKRCASGRPDCTGAPIRNDEPRPGDRLAVFRSQERVAVPVVGRTPDGLPIVQGRDGRYVVDVDGACSCILEVAS